jgi:hypothetical protein
MITFKYIFGGIIIATIYFFIIRNILEKNDIYKISRKNIDRILGLTQLHIMFIIIAIGLTESLNPFTESNFINSILDDTFLGSIYDFFYDERPAPDAYVVAIVDKIKQNQNTFVFVGLLFSAVESLGLISRTINRWVVEAISVVTSLCTLLYLNLLVDTSKLISSQSMMESVANYFGQSLTSALSWTNTMITITFICLIINHILYHKALDNYYAPVNKNKPGWILISSISICAIAFLAVFYKFMLVSDFSFDQKNIKQDEIITTMQDDNDIIEDNNKGKDYNDIKDIIDRWNYLHSSDNYISRTSLECLYTPTVKFYGQTIDAYKCVTLFADILKKYDSFSQKIKGDISYTELSENVVRCDFIKEVETNGKYNEYESYLVFERSSSGWAISEESDKITDANLLKSNKKSTNVIKDGNELNIIEDSLGNFKVYVEWPIKLNGIGDVRYVQKAIIKNSYFEKFLISDINECISLYLKESLDSESLGESETSGNISLKFVGCNGEICSFLYYIYHDLGSGTGAGVISTTRLLIYSEFLKRCLTINDLFSDEIKALEIVNSHISLDEYHSKADFLPDNFYFYDNNIVFVFPKYSIGYGYQGDVSISVSIDEFRPILSDKLKFALNGN